MGNPVVHWELMSRDPAKIASFYEKLFGWKIEHQPGLNYRLVQTQSEMGINGGIVKPDKPEPWPGNMTLYIGVDDLASSRKKVAEAGGTIKVEKEDVPDVGSYCLFTDPEGRMMGLFEPLPSMRGKSKTEKEAVLSHR